MEQVCVTAADKLKHIDAPYQLCNDVHVLNLNSWKWLNIMVTGFTPPKRACHRY